MNTRLLKTFTIFAILAFALSAEAASVRVKDITQVDGVRDNQLLGYGIVIGLEGTGDGKSTVFTAQAMANMLEKYGINVDAARLKLKNVASVMVTAKLPPFARNGSRIDVVVSSVGDAKSLQGGTLIQTPLKAANGEVYAVAQGPISVGGFSAGGGGSSVTKNHTTVGRIPNGALIERETITELGEDGMINLSLDRNDFTTATRIAQAINVRLDGSYARALDGNTVSVRVPPAYANNTVAFVSDIQAAEVEADTVAKVIVNERTGTVIVGGNVRISNVAVSHGNLTVEISTEFGVSQPNPLSGGETKVIPDSSVNVSEQSARLVNVDGGTTIDDLVSALNALRVTPRDLIAILQAVKEAGALQAQLEVI